MSKPKVDPFSDAVLNRPLPPTPYHNIRLGRGAFGVDPTQGRTIRWVRQAMPTDHTDMMAVGDAVYTFNGTGEVQSLGEQSSSGTLGRLTRRVQDLLTEDSPYDGPRFQPIPIQEPVFADFYAERLMENLTTPSAFLEGMPSGEDLNF